MLYHLQHPRCSLGECRLFLPQRNLPCHLPEEELGQCLSVLRSPSSHDNSLCPPWTTVTEGFRDPEMLGLA